MTGTLFTNPTTDFHLSGPLETSWVRMYASSAVDSQCGLGRGWSHTFAWRAERAPNGQHALIDERGAETLLRLPDDGYTIPLAFGRTISRHGDDLVVELGDGLKRVLRRSEHGAFLLSQIIDQAGRTIDVRWEDGEVTRIEDAVGRVAECSRQGRIRSWVLRMPGPDGAEHRRILVVYELDERGDLARVLDAAGAETRFTYDADHYLTSERLPDGLTYHFGYETHFDQRRCVETWGDMEGVDLLAALGRTPVARGPGGFSPRGIHHAVVRYGPGQHEARVTDAEGHVHTYEGNSLGLVTRYIDPRGYATSWMYNERGQLLSRTDGGGSTIRRSYDVLGRLVSITDPIGRVVRLERDERGLLVAVVDPTGARWRVSYDGKGRVVERRAPDGASTRFEYDANGLPSSITGPSGVPETMAYDAHGNLIDYVTSSGARWQYTFDKMGYPVEMRTPGGAVHRFRYDSRGDLVVREGPHDQRVEYAIDDGRRVVAVRHPGGGITRSTYVAGALRERVYPDGSLVRIAYDALLRPTHIVNPAGEAHSLAYDEGGNLAHETTFAGVSRSYEHDGADECVGSTDALGRRIAFLRDKVGRVLRHERPDGSHVVYEYDAFDRLVRAKSPSATVELERDARGRVVRETQTAGGFRFAAEHAYDAAGYRVATTFSTGWGVRFTRSPHGRIDALSVVSTGADSAEEIAFSYGVDGRERRREHPRAGAIVTERDLIGRPSRVSIFGPGGDVRRERAFRYAVEGPVSAVHDSRRGERRYELDATGRPLRASGLGAEERFRYSPHGVPIPADEPSTVGRGGRILESGRAALEWDARGRLVARREDRPERSWVYEFDDEDLLIRATRGDGRVVRYLYDPFGRRLAETCDGVTTWFGWDGDANVEEMWAQGAPARRIFAEDDFTPIAESVDGTLYLLATDAAATPWLGLGADGSLAELDLTTWGRLAHAQGWRSALRFAGQRADSWSGLVYNRHRYYAPDLGVFISPDPLGREGSLFDLGFVHNPTIYIDPLGLIILLASDDPALRQAADARARATNDSVVHYSALGPNSLAGHDHLEIVTHGRPGAAEWGSGNSINGKRFADKVMAAGFRGSTVDMTICNAGTRPNGHPSSTSFGEQFSERSNTYVSAMENGLVWTNFSDGSRWPADINNNALPDARWAFFSPRRRGGG